MSGGDALPHERRFHGGAERLRVPGRVALLEVERVVALSREGLQVSSVLDVGTGTGIFAEAFVEEGHTVAGIDPDAGLLAVARTLVPRSDFREGLAEELPFEDASFDLVFLGHVLHETDDPLRALSEAKRVARKRVVVLEWPYRAEEAGPPLAHRLPPPRILEMAAQAGFASIERITLGHMELYRMSPPAGAGEAT